MSTKLSDLRPAAAAAAAKAIRLLAEAGVPVCVTSTLRTLQEQQALFAQGRQPLAEVNRLRKIAGLYLLAGKENYCTVTNCDGVKYKSNHQGGAAIDVVPADGKGNPIWPPLSDPRWRQIADIMKLAGFINGLDWTKEKDGIAPDPPHHEFREG